MPVFYDSLDSENRDVRMERKSGKKEREKERKREREREREK